MGHDEQLGGPGRVRFGIVGAARRRALDADPRTSENEQVEIEFTRAPATAGPTPEGALDLLQAGQQVERAPDQVGATGSIEGDDRVAELGLVREPDGGGGIQARDSSEVCVRECCDGHDRLGQCPSGITQIRPQTEVGADVSIAHGLSVGGG